ncbi:hypothetical protein J8J42_04645 [Chryseobacterium sp. cx-311]|uniref:hypothetical protein n=1 Tax=Marnyiella aurantia TaxID=2758037 RepID=UPI001AE165B5|nr:hypothetical protein [Marnyiella aurantia]MBP0612334.1 hypothetical protein [Marnyiella aurantia]
MNDIYLPFQIGEQYENWEFDLDVAEKERVPGYDSYYFIWSKPFLHIIPNTIEMIFCVDILQAVIMEVRDISLHEISEVESMLIKLYGSYRTQKIVSHTVDIYTIDTCVVLWLISITAERRFIIAYGATVTLNQIIFR